MREMKDSGIAWIGAIPNHWRVSKIKQIVRWKSVKGQPDLPVLSLYRDYGVIPKDSRDDNHNVTSLDTSGYKVVEHGDLVINKMKAWQGSLAVSEYNGIVSPAYHICKITSENICKKYLHYLLRDASYLPEYMRLSTGLRVGQWDLSFDDFKNIPFLVPSLVEQERIAAFLDAECAEIDVVLEKTRASIEEYKKLKQAVITQAVTKGIFDKQIYPHNVKLKYLLYIASGDAIRNEELSEVGKYPAYGGGESLGFASKYNTLENSLIVGRVGARCGCVTYIDSKAWATDNALIVHPICNPRYMYYKRIPKKEVSKIVVYSSAPEQAVIGEIEVIKTLKMKPTPLWNSTKANAGISRSKYRKYFSGCTMAYAFVIGSFEKYPTSKSLADFNIQSAPQSFVYLDD